MKNGTVVVIAVAMLALISVPASAQNGQRKAVLKDRVEDIRDRKEDVRDRKEDVRDRRWRGKKPVRPPKRVNG